MSDKDDSPSNVRNQFRQAAKATCSSRSTEVSANGNTTGNTQNGNTKSSTQVESLVLPNSGALKRSDGATILGITKRRPSPLTIRLTDQQKQTIRAKAQVAGVSVNEYARAVMLSGDYRPPMNKEVCRQLLALGWELGRQGHNLNQIARHLNAGTKTPEQANNALALIRDELSEAYRAVYDALTNGREPPE